MQYWRGEKQTTKETPQPPCPFELVASFVKRRPGPERKLRLEQELVLTSIKLGLGLLVLDLGFRFHISTTTTTTVSTIFITWVKLISRELSASIVWPSRQQVKKTLSLIMFEKALSQSQMHY